MLLFKFGCLSANFVVFWQLLFTELSFFVLKYKFLARRDECPESYCRTPGVGVGVSFRVHKNFNLAHNS